MPVKPRQPDRPGPGERPLAAWLRLLTPAAAWLLAGFLLKRAWIGVVPGLAPQLSATQIRALASAATPLLLLPAALFICVHRPEAGGFGRALRARFPAGTALYAIGVGLALGALTAFAAGMLPDTAEQTVVPGEPAWLRALCLVSLCAAGPLCEEAVYRGLVFRRAEALLGVRGAALVSAALFAAGHGVAMRLPMDFVAGLVFAGVMLRQRRFSGSHWPLVAPALCHMAANLALLMLQR